MASIPPFEGHAWGTGRPWVMSMRWSELLFAHWPVSADAVRPALPAVLRPHLDTFAGSAWLGVVPFVMSRVRGRGLPPLPGLSRFAELNLRTYVRVGDAAGVWFFSLDAASRVAVRAARATFGLPYFDAAMRCVPVGVGTGSRTVRYESERTHRRAPAARFEAAYHPASRDATPTPGAPGTLEHFLTERYCLFALKAGRLVRGDIWHDPWRLRPASWDAPACDMTRLLADPAGAPGPPLDPAAALLNLAEPVDVRAWWPRPVKPRPATPVPAPAGAGPPASPGPC